MKTWYNDSRMTKRITGLHWPSEVLCLGDLPLLFSVLIIRILSGPVHAWLSEFYCIHMRRIKFCPCGCLPTR